MYVLRRRPRFSLPPTARAVMAEVYGVSLVATLLQFAARSRSSACGDSNAGTRTIVGGVLGLAC